MTRFLILLLAGCPKGRTANVAADLPEDAAVVESHAPDEVLAASAASHDPGARARALSLLIAEHGAEPWGATGLADESDWVRRAAVEALGGRSDAQSRALLEGVAADPAVDPYVRGLAAVRAPGPASSTAMSAAWPKEHEPWRVAPLALAAVRLGDEAARAPLERALGTGELPMDLEFLHELGSTGDPELAPGLERAQDRVEDELVLPVAAARLMLGDASAEQPLRKALGDADEEVRLEAIDFLVELYHPAAIALLRKAADGGPDLASAYAKLALVALGGSDGSEFVRAFEDREADRELRALAVRFAADLALEEPNRKAARVAQELALAGLADPDPSVRVAAAKAAARIGLGSSTPALTPLLADEVESVRIEAAGALLAAR